MNKPTYPAPTPTVVIAGVRYTTAATAAQLAAVFHQAGPWGDAAFDPATTTWTLTGRPLQLLPALERAGIHLDGPGDTQADEDTGATLAPVPPPDKTTWPRVHIENTDGVGRNTQITMDDGERLRWFNHAAITIPVDDVVTARLRVVRPRLRLTAHTDPDDLRATRASVREWVAGVEADIARLLGETEAP